VAVLQESCCQVIRLTTYWNRPPAGAFDSRPERFSRLLHIGFRVPQVGEPQMMKASALLTAAAAALTFGVLNAQALPTDGARLAAPSIGAPSPVEQAQY